MMRCNRCGREFTKTEVENAQPGGATFADFDLEPPPRIKCLAEGCDGTLDDL